MTRHSTLDFKRLRIVIFISAGRHESPRQATLTKPGDGSVRAS